MTGIKRFIALTAAVCLLAAAGAACAEIAPLETDLTVHGRPLQEDGWNDKEYQDESIHAVLNQEGWKAKSSSQKVTVRTVVIEIKDPSQIRSTLSFESFENQNLAKAKDMAKMVNAVVAINDDHTKFNKYQGYVVRQGVFYQDTLEKLKKPQDVLIIDDQGDFSVVIKASTETMEARIGELTADGRKPINVFTFGPALVLDGEALECKYEDSIHMMQSAGARTVIGQLDHLKYFVMTVDGAAAESSGMSGDDMGRYILKRFPECKVAYNLDGGNSSKLIWHGKEINKARGSARPVSGLIYFASAVTEDIP